MELQELTRDELLVIMPNAKSRVDAFLPYFNMYAQKYNVNTTQRMAHLLAQVAHESGELRYVKELASGEKYDTGKLAERLGNTPQKDGDGQKYKGRGLIQVTGRANYQTISKDLGVDFVAHPELLEQPQYAVASAFWYWNKHNLNALADKNDSLAITKRINGGTNGLDDRLKYLGRALKVLKV